MRMLCWFTVCIIKTIEMEKNKQEVHTHVSKLNVLLICTFKLMLHM